MFSRVIRDQRGNVGIMLALSLTALLAGAGGAIEYSRWNAVQADLYAALDTGVLAGTKELAESGNQAKAISIANDYFNKSLSKRDSFSALSINFKLNTNGDGLAAAGQADMKTGIMGIIGVNSLPLVSPSAAELVAAQATPPGGAEEIEVSLMLDVTGSMCDDGQGPCSTGTKISALKTASSGLIDKLLPSGKNHSSGSGNLQTKTRIAVVPFSTRVRLDNDGNSGVMQAVTGLPDKWSGFYKNCAAGTGSGASETNGNWTCSSYQVKQEHNWKIMPCVTDRFYSGTGTFDFTDSVPGSGNWLNGHGGDRMPVSLDSSDSPPSSDTGLTAADPAIHWNYDPNGGCADVSNGDKVVPLTDERSTLISSVNSLSAYGATGGVLGTAFSWYTLSPNWSSIWGSSSAPGPYSDLTAVGSTGAKKLRKVAVLMTDGAYNTFRGWKEQSVANVSAAAISMCQAMKADGIEIFTVGFALNSLSATEATSAQNVLSSCATDANHYVDANSAADLIKAFDGIAATLVAGDIRLIK